MEEVLRAVVRFWRKQIEYARKYRAEEFDETANKIRRYYRTKNRWIALPSAESDQEDEGFATGRPYHKVAIGKVGTWVRTMLPFVHYKAPTRLVLPGGPKIPDEILRLLYQIPPEMPLPPNPQDARDRLRCLILQHTLNYAAEDATFGFSTESRRAVQDALICRGVVWHELADLPTGELPGSFWEDERNVYWDPDATVTREASFLVRKRIRPAWQVAEEFAIPEERIKGAWKSYLKQAQDGDEASTIVLEDGEHLDRDLCLYYEVFSRRGLGHRLVPTTDEELAKAAELFDSAGDNVYLAILPGLDYPANLDPDKLKVETASEISERLAWPIPTWGDFNDPWPCTELAFYPDGLYPKPPLEDAIPLQAFLDYAYSYLIGKVKTVSRDIIICSKALAADLQQAVEQGFDNEVVAVDDVNVREMVDKLIHILQFNPLQRDVYDVIAAVDREWEIATGVSDLLRGASPAKMMRSAQEAADRQTNAMIQPNDLRDTVQAWHSAVERKEAIAQRLVLRENVATILGESLEGGMMGPLTEVWMSDLATDDPYVAATELTYTVEAGSGQRKDHRQLLSDLNLIAPVVMPLFQQVYQATGDPTQINALLSDMAEAAKLDPNRYLLPPMMPAPPAVPEGPPQAEGEPESPTA